MRRAAWLLPVIVIGILIALGYTYQRSKEELARQAPAKPEALQERLQASAEKWEYAQYDGDRPKVIIRADSFSEIKDPPQTELNGVELHIYKKDGKTFDLVKSRQARFTKGDRALFAEGDVAITMGVPEEGPAPGRILEIQTSGVRYEVTTNKASTDRAVAFKFDRGEGKAVGAEYDPATAELRLRSAVDLTWRDPADPKKTMRVEAGEALYSESQSKVFLRPWAKLHRDTLTLESKDATVLLEEGIIRQVDAQQANGTHQYPQRKLEFGALGLTMLFTRKGAAEKITGTQEAKLVALSETARTRVSGDVVELTFRPAKQDETVLERAFAQGKARVESESIPRAGQTPAESKILTSEAIEVKMRANGEEIDRVETHYPGRLELAPRAAGQRRRQMEGERIYFSYGEKNVLRSMRSVKASTRTEPDAQAPPGSAPALTWSDDLEAHFDSTGAMAKMEQWSRFRYQEGTRQATAERATLEQTKNEITLVNPARIWDLTGSTEAERIVLDQKSGNFSAFGRVRSVREAEAREGGAAKRPGEVVSKEEPLRATADQMFSTDKNRQVRYEGRAVMWQGANRLSAHRIDLNRSAQELRAYGQVVSQLVDKDAPGEKAKEPMVTIVRAPELFYSDRDKLAHYKGNAVLNRPGLEVKGLEIRAYLAEEDPEASATFGTPDSGLEKAFATGNVQILDTRPDWVRQGWGDRGEYQVREGRLELTGPASRMNEAKNGVPQRTAQGRQLTWFANNDRLLVDGAESQPAVSKLRRK